MANRRTTTGANLRRRRFLVGSAAVAGGLAARGAMAFGLTTCTPALLLDSRYPEGVRFERIAAEHGATAVQLQPEVLAHAESLLSERTVIAGLTTYADFTVFGEVARSRGLKLRFHAYYTPLSATRVRYRTLVSHGTRLSPVPSDVTALAWDQMLIRRLLGAEPAVPPKADAASTAARFGYTLHSWRFDT